MATADAVPLHRALEAKSSNIGLRRIRAVFGQRATGLFGVGGHHLLPQPFVERLFALPVVFGQQLDEPVDVIGPADRC